MLIPARGGSKGLPGKNLKPVAGISLVGRAARVGRRFLREAGVNGDVLIDTDSQPIADEAVRWGAEAPFLRPVEFAADSTPTIDNVLYALERLEAAGRRYDVVVLLQPTSPLRETRDVAACFATFDAASGSVISITSAEHPPEQALRLGSDGSVRWAWPELGPDVRRQDLEPAFRPSGAVYVSSVESLRRNKSFIVPGRTRGVALPPERSVDIDTARDLALAEEFARSGGVRGMRLGAHTLGSDNRCFVIAEAGVNHNGRLELAHQLVDVAADAGADAVKFQTFEPARLVSSRAQMAEYQVANTGRQRTQAQMLQELVLPRAAHAELMRHAQERGVLFLSTPFDEGSADFLQELGVSALKVPSGELTNHPFLAHLAGKGLPILVSTGMADMAEVDAALEVIATHGNPDLALFHCVTSYPAAASDTNLAAIDTLRAACGVPVGLSDHTEGIAIAIAAVARGASLIEKHFTLDRSMPGPDHKASLEPAELSAMMRAIRAVEAARGDGVKAPRPVELPLRAVARKSLHAARDLPAGHALGPGDLVALRPGDGVQPSRLSALLGTRLRRPLAEGEQLTEADVG